MKKEIIAIRVRKEFEKISMDVMKLTKIYDKYNKIENTENFVKQGLAQFPKLNCGLASSYLQDKIGGEIIKGKFGDNNHSFLKLGKNIVDITADQYGGPKVYIGPLIKPWSVK